MLALDDGRRASTWRDCAVRTARTKNKRRPASVYDDTTTMGTHELAVVGLVGSGVGALLGTPLVWPGLRGRIDVRILGAVLLTGAGLAGLISARLGGLVPGSDIVNHGVNALGLVAFSLAAAYVRLATGASPLLIRSLTASIAVYAALSLLRAGTTGRSEVPFLWLAPLIISFTVTGAVAVWRREAVRDALVPPAWVVGFLAVVNAAQVVRLGFSHVPAVRAIVPLALASGFLGMVTFLAWRAVSRLAIPAQHDKPRYERSGLAADAALGLLARVDQAMQEQRLFARTDLTLALLAGAAGSTPHQVSEALNRFRGETFHECVSRWRLNDVKAQLAIPDSERYTIEGIGAAAGFGSRSALYAAFQRFEGMTPTAYRAAVRGTARSVGAAAPPDAPPDAPPVGAPEPSRPDEPPIPK